MSIKGSASKSKSATSGTGSFTSSTTPNAPSWVTGLSQSFADQIPNLKPQVAGLSGLEQDAIGGLSGQNFGGLFNDAAGILRASAGQSAPSINAGDGAKGIDKFMNPYISDVVDATANDLDYSAAGTRSQQALDLARNQAFGGSGAAITRSMTEGELARARASALGGLRAQGFSDAAQLSQAEESRKLQASIAQAQASAAASAQQQAAAQGLLQIGNTGLNQQTGLGETQRGVDQSILNLPITTAATQIGLFGDLPIDTLTGQTTNGTETRNSTTKGSSVGVEAGYSYGGK